MHRQNRDEFELHWEDYGLFVLTIIAAIILVPAITPFVENAIAWWVNFQNASLDAQGFVSHRVQSSFMMRNFAVIVVPVIAFLLALVPCLLVVTTLRILLGAAR